MQLRVKTTLVNERGVSFMGGGLAVLLREIEVRRSIHRAALETGMSYVKALKILNRLERNLGQEVVTRHRGGHEHGGAELTEFGRRLLAGFERMSRRIEERAQDSFVKFCEKMGLEGQSEQKGGRR